MTALEELDAIRRELRVIHPFLSAKLRKWIDTHVVVAEQRHAIPLHELCRLKDMPAAHNNIAEKAFTAIFEQAEKCTIVSREDAEGFRIYSFRLTFLKESLAHEQHQ